MSSSRDVHVVLKVNTSRFVDEMRRAAQRLGRMRAALWAVKAKRRPGPGPLPIDGHEYRRRTRARARRRR